MGTEDIVERRARVSCAGGTVLHPAVKGVRTEDGQFSLRVTGERFRGMRGTEEERVGWSPKPPSEHSVEKL